MPLINPDTSAAQEMSAIEPGTYPAKIVAVDFQNSAKGNPMIVPRFEIEVEGKKRTRKSFLVITGEGAYGFDQLLRATGFADVADQYRDPSQDNPPFDTDDLIGIELNVVIDHQLYQGETRDYVKAYQKA